MDQEPLFYEDFRESVRHLIGALGGPKRIGGMLRPMMSVKRAEAWIHDCLNPDRDTKFDFEDLAAIFRAGREAGVHCAMYQLADEAGYAHPDIAPQKTPRQELVAKYEQLVAELHKLADEEAALARAETLRQIRAVGKP